jgi:hypothetical protein
MIRLPLTDKYYVTLTIQFIWTIKINMTRTTSPLRSRSRVLVRAAPTTTITLSCQRLSQSQSSAKHSGFSVKQLCPHADASAQLLSLKISLAAITWLLTGC